jgi:Carboxypeptidase regulatory-like domain
MTNPSGNYTLPQLAIGDYEIKAEKSGFKVFNQRGIVLNADSVLPVNITLQVGEVTQTLTVQSTPPALKTQSNDISTLVAGTQVQELALNGRNFTQFLTLGTGVNSSEVGRRMGVGQEGNPLMSINGGRVNSTQFTYDGILAMDTGGNRGLDLFPAMGAIEEIQIHKSNYSADSGSYGYGQVNLVTKAGGSEYHGSVYETLGNKALDARNFFDSTVSPFRQNIFGFTIGGPVFASKNSRMHEKAFFFWSEGWNKRQGPQMVSFVDPPQATFTATTPDAAMRMGDFSGVSTPIIDPTTGQQFTGNIIPPSMIDPNATILLNNFYPLPNRAGTPNFAYSTSAKSDWREELGRFDYHFTDKMSLMVRYAQDSWAQNQDLNKPGPTAFPTVPGFFSKPGKNLVLQLTNMITPTTLNQFTFGFSINRINHIPTDAATRPSGLTIPTVFGSNVTNVIPEVDLGQGFGNIGVNALVNVNPVFTYRDDLTHQMGNHSLKAGFLIYRLLKFDTTQITGNQGLFNFNGSATGNSVADFLLGDAFEYTESGARVPFYLFANDYEMYFQDDWKVRSDLTLNLGFREEIMASAPDGYDKYDRMSIFVPALYDPSKAPTVLSNGQLVPGTGDPLNGIITPGSQQGLGLPRALRKTRYNPGPRVGFAWSPGGSTTTVIRGGYGVFYHWDNSSQESLSNNPPFARSASIFSTSLSNPAGGAAALFPPSVTSQDYNNLYPNVQQWSMSVERRLPADTVLSVAYVGNHAVHLDQSININQLLPGQANGVNANTVRPYLGYAAINFDERSAAANYNGLQVDMRRNFKSGLAFEVAYTYSKAMQFQAGQGQYLQKSEKGIAALDRTHVMTINYVYDLPFMKNATGFEGKVLGGWEVSGITTFQAGLPNTVTISGDRAQVGGGTQRPDLVGPLNIHPGNINNYFDTSAFALGPVGQFGNAGVNILRGPGIADFDFNLRKNTTFHLTKDREANAQFSVESFNIFNHPNFVGVGTTFGSASFGHLTSTLDGRNIDFQLRITF